MKILFVVEYYYPHIGGVETFFQKLAEGLAEQGYNITVFTAQIENSKKEDNINGVNIKRISLPNFGRRYWFTFLAPFWLLFIIPKYNIVHTTTYNAALPAWLISFIFRKKIVITVHEVWQKLWFSVPEMSKISSLLHYCFEWVILKLPYSCYAADADFTKKRLIEFRKSEKNIHRIYLGIDYDLFNKDKCREVKAKKINNNNWICLYFGRPGWVKGLNYLIKAMPLVKAKIKNVQLQLLISNDPPKPYKALIKLINDEKINDIISIQKSVSRESLPNYIASADCVVVPSLSEGFGFSAAETSAMQVPIVATTAGSLPEVLSGKVIFCLPGDSKSLALAIIDAYNNKYKQIPEKKFNWQNTILEYNQIYKTLNIK